MIAEAFDETHQDVLVHAKRHGLEHVAIPVDSTGDRFRNDLSLLEIFDFTQSPADDPPRDARDVWLEEKWLERQLVLRLGNLDGLGDGLGQFFGLDAAAFGHGNLAGEQSGCPFAIRRSCGDVGANVSWCGGVATSQKAVELDWRSNSSSRDRKPGELHEIAATQSTNCAAIELTPPSRSSNGVCE